MVGLFIKVELYPGFYLAHFGKWEGSLYGTGNTPGWAVFDLIQCLFEHLIIITRRKP